MNMTDVVEVCVLLGICPEPGPLGVRIGSTGWRIECGSGIAGNGDKWWIRVISGMYHPDAPDAQARNLGPVQTKAELKKLLLDKWKGLSEKTVRER